MWDRSNQLIQGMYMDVEYRGIVRNSRVKYGGDVQHTVDLLDTIEVHGVERELILVNESDQFVVLEELVCVWH
jgi:hypothetical protein